MNWREFRRKSGNKTLYWKIAQQGESYATEHGQVGTTNPQTFSDTPGEKGKPGTKAFVNANDNCSFNVLREIRKKEEHGYIEYVNGEPVKEEVVEVTFDAPLPKNFCSYKPQTSIKEKALEKLHKSGLARYTRKRDGLSHICCKHEWGWEIYTRRMDITTERYPEILSSLDNLSFDVGTIIVGEMICQINGIDNFKAASRISKSDVPVALNLVSSGEVPAPEFCIFDIIYYNGESLQTESYDSRRKKIENISQDYISIIELEDVTPDTWEDIAKKNNWEGYVVVDGSSVPGEKFFSFDGDAKRPNGHYKLKPEYTDECVMYAASVGTGKRLGKIGAIFVKQKHPETGEWFDCGKVGSGFTDEDIDQFVALCSYKKIQILKKDKLAQEINLSDEHDVVVEIKYTERQEDTNKFRFPVFLRLREDKAPNECFAQNMK